MYCTLRKRRQDNTSCKLVVYRKNGSYCVRCVPQFSPVMTVWAAGKMRRVSAYSAPELTDILPVLSVSNNYRKIRLLLVLCMAVQGWITVILHIWKPGKACCSLYDIS